MTSSVTAFAPASVSNVACGFDIMGFALDEPGDLVTVRLCKTPGVRITALHGFAEGLPLDVSLNTAGAPAAAMMRDFGKGRGIDIEVRKGFPAGGGIGSSAASAVAAAVALDALLGTRLPKSEILNYAIEGEKIASGGIHVDNLAPSLYGGFILVRGYHPIDIVRIPVPGGLWCAVISPDVVIRTKEAREILPTSIPLDHVVMQTGNAAGLVAGLLLDDFELIGRSLHDVIAEPVRGRLIPGFADMRSAALAAGALGCSISGSGPAMFALASSRPVAEHAAIAMRTVLQERKLTCQSYVTGISQRGAEIVNRST